MVLGYGIIFGSIYHIRLITTLALASYSPCP